MLRLVGAHIDLIPLMKPSPTQTLHDEIGRTKVELVNEAIAALLVAPLSPIHLSIDTYLLTQNCDALPGVRQHLETKTRVPGELRKLPAISRAVAGLLPPQTSSAPFSNVSIA